jgi:hypothetical protein
MSTTNPLTTVYINPPSSQQLRDIANVTLPDGSPAIKFVCLFGGNYAADVRPYLRANNDDPPTTQPLNSNIQQVLDDGSAMYLQSKGIKVLLTVLNGLKPVGWSEFTSQAAAEDFASYLQAEIVDAYSLDGIDIDDEYSSGTPNDTSLIMVTTLMRQIMPGKLITKALWADSQYFQSSWSGHSLAENLDYGWEMSYGGSPSYRMPPYVKYGMSKTVLSCGFWSQQPSPNPAADISWLQQNGYGGFMVYAYEAQENQQLFQSLLGDWIGAQARSEAGGA